MRARFVAPAGTVIRLSDLAAWARGASGPGSALEGLAERFRARMGTPHVFFLSSGRAAMTEVLRVLADSAGPARREVLVPGYTCYSVGASAVRAGLQVRPLDVDPGTLDYAPEALGAVDPDRTLALVSANLYGIPNDLPRLEAFARETGIAFVDDAAQSLDARVGERFAGTFGDVGIFSFDKGKNITTLQGGVVVCRDDELADRLGVRLGSLPEPPRSRSAVQTVSLLAYAVLLRPWLYWIPDRMLPLGETPWELDYPTTAYDAGLAPLAVALFDRVDELTAQRRRIAAAYRERLSGLPGIRLPKEDGVFAVYPRFPTVFEDGRLRDEAVAALRGEGIGATGSYPRALVDVPELREHLAPGVRDTPGARSAAEGILTLPTHGWVGAPDIQRATDTLARLTGAERRLERRGVAS